MPNTHDQIINTGIALNYDPDSISDGCCHGFTIKWLEACLLGDEKRFNVRIKTIVEDKSLVQKLSQIKEKIKLRTSVTPEELDLLEIFAFYDSMVLFHMPGAYDAFFTTSLAQQDIDKVSTIAASNKTREQGGLISSYIGSALYTREAIRRYLDKLRLVIEEMNYPPQTPIAFTLAFPGHAIGITYKTGMGLWSLMDINQWPPIQFASNQTTEMAQTIFNTLSDGSGDPNLAFSTTLISTGQQRIPHDQLLTALKTTVPKFLNIPQEQVSQSNFSNLAYLAVGKGDSLLLTEIAKYTELNQLIIPKLILPKNLPKTTLAYLAAQNGYAEIIAIFAKHKVDLNIPRDDGVTPALIAAFHGHVDVLIELAKHGVDLSAANEKGTTVAKIAAIYGHADIISALVSLGININAPDESGVPPIYFALEKGHKKVIDTLISLGIDLNASSVNGCTLAYAAACNGHVDVIAELARRGADLNIATKEGFSPLYLAAQEGHIQVIAELAKHGINFNATNKYGVTPVHIAALHGDVQVIAELAKHGANLNVSDNNRMTPLDIAIENNHDQVIEELKKQGIDINTPNVYGITPLLMAVARERENIVSYLLQNKNIDENKTLVISSTSLNNLIDSNNLKAKARMDSFIKLKMSQGEDKNALSISPREMAYIMNNKNIVGMFNKKLFYKASLVNLAGILGGASAMVMAHKCLSSMTSNVPLKAGIIAGGAVSMFSLFSLMKKQRIKSKFDSELDKHPPAPGTAGH